MELYFVTGNEMKAREAAAILPGIKRIKMDLPEIQSLDPQEVLRAKLKEAHAQMPDKTLIVEDVTYSIAGIGGLPGTLIKWFVESIGPSGISGLVVGKDAQTEVAANIGLIKPDGQMTFVSGVVSGKTVSIDPASSEAHFDGIFMPDGNDLRYSEMTPEAKNKISHRGLAWRKLKEQLEL